MHFDLSKRPTVVRHLVLCCTYPVYTHNLIIPAYTYPNRKKYNPNIAKNDVWWALIDLASLEEASVSMGIKAWFTYMSEEVPDAKKVKEKIESALERWEAGGRWKDIVEEEEKQWNWISHICLSNSASVWSAV